MNYEEMRRLLDEFYKIVIELPKNNINKRLLDLYCELDCQYKNGIYTQEILSDIYELECEQKEIDKMECVIKLRKQDIENRLEELFEEMN